MKGFIVAILGFALFLTGCVSTQSVVSKLENQYIGKSFDDFVVKHGTPKNKYVLSSGDFLYTWSSETINNIGNVSTDASCEAQFVTSPDGKIKQINIIKDHLGYWSSSICHEVFYKL